MKIEPEYTPTHEQLQEVEIQEKEHYERVKASRWIYMITDFTKDKILKLYELSKSLKK